MSTIFVDNLRSNLSTKITVPSGNTLYAAGHIVSIKQVENSSIVTASTAGEVDLSLEITITPVSTNSTFYLTGSIHGNMSTTNAGFGFSLYRDSTRIKNEELMSYTPTAGMRNTIPIGGYIDSPSTTSSITYKLKPDQFSGTVEYNETARGISTFTVMEIAG